jgi:prepilin-type N-terminal cleavage/methylation domain-containing protein
MLRKSSGFTLIEIAIVLVIIGLLLGGVLKGQELITGARVRNLISQQDGIKAAFFGFQDRYRALAGDYAAASVNIKCVETCPNGNGNGQVESVQAVPAAGPTPAVAAVTEDLFVWTHLSASGFLNGSYAYMAADTGPNDTNSPKNPYSVYLQLIYDNAYGDGTGTAKHNLKTGSQIPVEIIAEVDRKIDDGRPNSGAFQYSAYAPPGANAPVVEQCTASGNWNITASSTNCGAASLF